MAVISITSDWGLRDYYLASLKGKIFQLIPDAHIVDISHHINTFNIFEAYYLLKNAYQDFPEGSVHIVTVMSEIGKDSTHCIAYYDKHYFISNDNGLFSLLFEKEPDKLIEIDVPQDGHTFTFPAKDLFAKVAAHIINGGNIEELGISKTKILSLIKLRPIVDEDRIVTQAIYIDNFGNVVFNLCKDLFFANRKRRNFSIYINSKRYEINCISESYNDVQDGEILAIFNANDYLEIAVCRASANRLLNLNYEDTISIEFYEQRANDNLL